MLVFSSKLVIWGTNTAIASVTARGAQLHRSTNLELGLFLLKDVNLKLALTEFVIGIEIHNKGTICGYAEL